MRALERIYLPMTTRPAGYCVTSIEQQHLARRFGLEIEIVRAHLVGMMETIAPQKTATKTKAIIEAELNAVMQSASGRDSKKGNVVPAPNVAIASRHQPGSVRQRLYERLAQ